MTRRVILPGDTPVPSNLTILVPRGYETGEVQPVGECYLCGAEFFPGDNQARHMRQCVRERADDFIAERAAQRKRLAALQPWDPEIAEHMRNVGERMKREGRLVVRPNERAGF
jgi:hypothetical protein